MTMREMRPVASSPMWVQVSPPSVDFHTPLPMEMLERMKGSPVPAHTTLGAEGATASSPTDGTPALSKTGSQLEPPSVVFQIPPAAAPA